MDAKQEIQFDRYELECIKADKYSIGGHKKRAETIRKKALSVYKKQLGRELK